jgi:hypothetical protein
MPRCAARKSNEGFQSQMGALVLGGGAWEGWPTGRTNGVDALDRIMREESEASGTGVTDRKKRSNGRAIWAWGTKTVRCERRPSMYLRAIIEICKFLRESCKFLREAFEFFSHLNRESARTEILNCQKILNPDSTSD